MIALGPGPSQHKADSMQHRNFGGSAKQQVRRPRVSKSTVCLVRGLDTLVGGLGCCTDAQARITGGQMGALG